MGIAFCDWLINAAAHRMDKEIRISGRPRGAVVGRVALW